MSDEIDDLLDDMDEPQPERVEDPVEAQQPVPDEPPGDKVVTADDLNNVFLVGYELDPCPEGLPSVLQVAWAKGVWQRQGELMPESKDPDMKAKLRAQLKGEQAPAAKKRSSWD